MLKKLQWKMVFLNIGVVAFILAIVISLQFYSSMSILRRQAESIKERIETSKEVFNRNPFKFHESPVLGNKLVMIPVDSDGNLYMEEEIQSFPVDGERLDLFETINENLPDMKYIELDDRVYFTFNVSKDGITYYYFLDATQERALNLQNMRNTAFIGLFAIVLIVFASIFLTIRALKPVKSAWEQQKRFVADASHELRTPIAVIKTNMEVVGEDNSVTVGSQRKWIDNVNEETDRMASLIDNLLYISKKDISNYEKYKTETAMNEFVDKAVAYIELIAKEKGLSVNRDLEPVEVHIPGSEITRLASILVENAIKYTDKGKIVITTRRDGTDAVLSVKDSGIGIDYKDFDKIFERFYRVDESRTRGAGGYGLGLSIARSICDSYNGKISVESEPGKGSTFSVVFPAVK